MQIIRSVNLQKNLGEVLRAADVEAVVVVNRDQPRTVVMSADEFIRLKVAAGEPVPAEVRRSRPTLHRPDIDPLGYDTTDPNFELNVAKHALSGEHQAEIQAEVESALRRWGMKR
jgi:PHD/YefM family antitoxin component YafN of YafNO toxin-antitoxin module